MYRKFNANPAGRSVGDCTIRAISKALNQPWEQTFIEICDVGLEVYDMPSSNAVWGKYLQRKGFTRRFLPEGYTIRSFAAEHPHGTYIIPVSGHVICVKNGDYFDTWNSGDETPLYIYERKD